MNIFKSALLFPKRIISEPIKVFILIQIVYENFTKRELRYV